jgi:hypothetical protein
MTRSASRAIAIAPGRIRRRPTAKPRCRRSHWCGTFWVGAARPGSAEVARDWAHPFLALPHRSQANRRIRWLWAASGQPRAMLTVRLPADDCRQAGTSVAWATTSPSDSAATPRTPDAPTVVGWPSMPDSAPGSSAPGASCPGVTRGRRRSAQAGGSPAICCATRALPARRSPRSWPPRAPRCSSRPPGTSSHHACDHADDHRPLAQTASRPAWRDHRPDGLT